MLMFCGLEWHVFLTSLSELEGKTGVNEVDGPQNNAHDAGAQRQVAGASPASVHVVLTQQSTGRHEHHPRTGAQQENLYTRGPF